MKLHKEKNDSDTSQVLLDRNQKPVPPIPELFDSLSQKLYFCRRFIAMKHLLTIFVLLLVLSACDVGRNSEMSALLDWADSMNRAYIPMTDGSDSLLLEATKYYDRHGNANQQMRAHYLLGCAYRDMDEAPAALQSYQNAADRADTLSSDCDYHRLMSVYGQMAELFHAQNLPSEELRIALAYGKLALQIKDTLGYIRNLELMNKAYYLMHDSARMYQVLEEAQRLYLAHGYTEEAASINGAMAYRQLQNGNIEEAGRLLSIFEKESGLFDKDNNITGGRDYYYYTRGLYYQKKEKPSEAEHYYRKLLSKGQNLLGYKALMSLYCHNFNIDSVKKYAYLYEIAMDTYQDNMQTDALLNVSKLYDYQRLKEKAEKEEEQSRQAKRHLWASITVTGIIIILICLYILYYKKRKHKEMVRLYSEYLNVLSKYNQSSDDYRKLKVDAAQFEKSKQEEVESLQQQLLTYQNQLISMGTSEKLSVMSQSDIVETFHQKAKRKRNIQEPDSMEWKTLYNLMTTEIPFIKTLIGGERILSTKELHVCLLLILGFTNIEISKLVNLTPQRFSNLKRLINKKIFHDESAASLEDNIKGKFLNM